MTKEYIHNQVFTSKIGENKTTCLYRCIINKYETLKQRTRLGKFKETYRTENLRKTLTNRCRLTNNKCQWHNDSELSCSVPKYKEKRDE